MTEGAFQGRKVKKSVRTWILINHTGSPQVEVKEKRLQGKAINKRQCTVPVELACRVNNRERGNHNANTDINSIYTSIEKYEVLTQRSKQRTLSLSTSNIMAMSWITWVILGETHQLTSVTQCSWHMPHSMSEGDLKTIRGSMNCKGTGRPLSWQEVKHEKLYWLTPDLKEEIFISSVHSADTQKCQVLIKKKKEKVCYSDPEKVCHTDTGKVCRTEREKSM